MHRGGGKGEAGSAYELLAPGVVPGGLRVPGAPGRAHLPTGPVVPMAVMGSRRAAIATATATPSPPYPAAKPAVGNLRPTVATDFPAATRPRALRAAVGADVHPVPPTSGGLGANGAGTPPSAGPDPTPAVTDTAEAAADGARSGTGTATTDESHQPTEGATTMDAGTKVDTVPTVPAPPTPPESDQPTRHRSPRRKVAVVLGALVAVVVLVLTVQPWNGAQATPSHPASSHPAGAGAAPQHPSSLAYTAAPSTQPPPTVDPSAPGQLVASGENRSDPFLLHTAGRYYLYTSGTTSIPFLNVPVASTTDFVTWTKPKDAMVHLPTWAAEPFTWGPDVHQFGSTYVLYFTGFLKAFDEQCIGAAVSSSPDGPFKAQARPFICQSNLSGSIDPRVFTDSSGTLYMQWKSDQNAHGSATPTTLWSQRLGADGLSLLGSPSALMSPDEPWQGTVIEAPDMVEVDGVYWLTYAANWFNQPAYGIGVAWCKGPVGPCADLTDQPLISSNAQGQGPGEPSFYQDATGVWMLYTPIKSLDGDPPRPVFITRVGFTTKGAYLAAGGPPPSLTAAPPAPTSASAP